MAQRMGIWIDHRQAILVQFSDDGPRIEKLKSKADRPLRGGEATSLKKEPGLRLSQTPIEPIHRFYDQVIDAAAGAEAIALAGPAEAKGELRKRMESRHLGDSIVSVAALNKTTSNRLVEYFRKILLPDSEYQPVRAMGPREEKTRRHSKSPGPAPSRRRNASSPGAPTSLKRLRGPATQIMAGESPKTQRSIRRGTGKKNLYANMPGARKER